MLSFTLISLMAALAAEAAPVLESRAGCKKIMHIHARGTAEPGNLGMLVGSPFSTALLAKFGSVDSQGVVYSADVIGAITGAMMPQSQSGATKMASMAKDTLRKCPESKIVLSGYSQGAEQVHGALKNLGMEASKIGAAVTFGDPMNMALVSFNGGWGALPSSRAKVYCYPGDPVCGGLGISHLSYASSAGEAATFVAKAISSMGGVSSSSGSSSSSSSSSSSLADLFAKASGGSKDSKDTKGSKDSKSSSGSSSSSSSAALQELLAKAKESASSKDSKSKDSKSSGSKDSKSSSSKDSKGKGKDKKEDKKEDKDSSDTKETKSSGKESKSGKGKGKNNVVDLEADAVADAEAEVVQVPRFAFF